MSPDGGQHTCEITRLGTLPNTSRCSRKRRRDSLGEAVGAPKCGTVQRRRRECNCGTGRDCGTSCGRVDWDDWSTAQGTTEDGSSGSR